MVAIAERKVLRLGVMFALYIAQGLPYGFVIYTFSAYLGKQGASPSEIGDIGALSLLPWSFKWLWAPLVDRFSHSVMGRRRPWILLGQGMLLTGATILAFAPTDDLALLGWLVFGCNVFAALQDVSVDALAVDLLPESERGFANGLMYGGSYLGVIIGASGLSTILGRYGLQAALLTQVALLAVIMMLPLFLRERSTDKVWSLRFRERTPEEAAQPNLFKNLAKAFARRSPLVAAVLALVILLGGQTIVVVRTVLLTQELGWSEDDYGQMMGGLPLVLGLGGSIGGGWLADRVGHKTMVACASVLLGAWWIFFGLVPEWWPDDDFIFAGACAGELIGGMLSAALFALLMGVSWPAVAASQFTAYMALLNLGRTIGSKLSGSAYEAFDVSGTFIAFGIAQISVVVLLLAIDPDQNRRELSARS